MQLVIDMTNLIYDITNIPIKRNVCKDSYALFFCTYTYE